MHVKIAVVADVHYDNNGDPAGGARRRDIADVILLRAAHRLNRLIRPDITLLVGDLVDCGEAPGAAEDLASLRDIADKIEGPVIAIPGNHDGSIDAFYKAFERPPEVTDVKGCRFVAFLDPEEPDYNARRTPADLERMAAARAGFDGPIVAVQHCPVFPPGTSDCPVNYVNAEEVVAAMRQRGIRLALSGHHHRGVGLIEQEGVAFLVAPAVCEAPFRFLEIDLGETGISVREHALRMPDELELVDTHVHTPFAYCNENMDIAKAMRLGEEFGLAGLVFAEHTGHLYFDKATYWEGAFLNEGIAWAQGRQRRIEAYLDAAEAAGCPPENVATEVDCDFEGRPVLLREDKGQFSYLIGAMHRLRSLQGPSPSLPKASEEFLGTLERFLKSGIRVLAHPFRVFRRAGVETPEALFEPTVKLLREHRVAAEVNFHTNEPPAAFFRRCIEADVPLTFGSDAHNLYEVGEFAPHLALLSACGYDGDIGDLLLDPRRGQ